jgi:hypothetical protein
MEGGVGLAVWLVIALVLVGIEVATLTFVALYLAAGAVGAGIAALAGAGLPLQVLVFAVVSVASLLLTRKPLVRALRKTPPVVSNAPTVVGSGPSSRSAWAPARVSAARCGSEPSSGAPAPRTSARSARVRPSRSPGSTALRW